MSRVAARAIVYDSIGFRSGDRVFIHFGNCLEFFVELLAIWRAGACAVPIDPRFTPFEIETLAAWAKPRHATFLGRDRRRVSADSRAAT